MKQKLILILALIPFLVVVVVLLKGPGREKPIPQTEPSTEPTSSETASQPTEKFDLKILYAGLPDTERAKDFMDFLEDHFTQVMFTDYNQFSETAAKDYGVVIFDHDGSNTQAPTPNISRTYSQATVTMGVPGADISSRQSLKTGYL